MLFAAERAALLAGRDDEFTMLVTIGYTGMRWGEAIGLERDPLLPSRINIEWQLREINGRFHRLPPKDDSYRSTNVEPFVPGMRGLYAHASQRMRDELTADLQARWEESLRERAAIDPHSTVPLLDALLAPFRTQPAGHPGRHLPG